MKEEDINLINLGMVTQWFHDSVRDKIITGIKNTDGMTYLFIVRSCIGYGQYQTSRISTKDFEKSILSTDKTVTSSIKRLIDANLIERVKSNKSDVAYKQAYKYKLVFREDLGFPLSQLVLERE